VSLNLNDKKAVVAEVSAKVATAQTIVLAEYRGIEVGHLTKLREDARKKHVYLRVLKNTLARRAVEGTAFSALASEMTGPLIYAFSEDAVLRPKSLTTLPKAMTSWSSRQVITRAVHSTRRPSPHWQIFRAVKFSSPNCWE